MGGVKRKEKKRKYMKHCCRNDYRCQPPPRWVRASEVGQTLQTTPRHTHRCDALVDATEPPCFQETLRRLQPRFDRVQGEQGHVHGQAGDGAGSAAHHHRNVIAHNDESSASLSSSRRSPPITSPPVLPGDLTFRRSRALKAGGISLRATIDGQCFEYIVAYVRWSRFGYHGDPVSYNESPQNWGNKPKRVSA
jgi:hypothetical protein